MTPLRVTATLAGPIALAGGHLAIDALLAWATATRDGLPPPAQASDCTPLEIPLEREPGGRFHLASLGIFDREQAAHRFVNRRFPIEEAQMMGASSLKRVLLSGGPTKSYRLPLATWWLVGDRIDWFAVGDRGAGADLLSWVGYLGKRRAVGVGRVQRWEVDECEPWGEGFPVVRDGRPLRPLPLDWPGLVEPRQALQCMTYPYWDHTREVACAVPG